MASKAIQEFNQDALDHFGIDMAPIGVVSGSSINIVTHTQDEEAYGNVLELLQKPTVTGKALRNKTKAYILPRNSVSMDRIKSILKSHSIKLVNKIEDADVLINNNDMFANYENEERINTTHLGYKLWNFKTLEDTCGSFPMIDNSTIPILAHEGIYKGRSYYNWDYGEDMFDEWILSGLAVNAAYLVATTELDVCDTETLMNEATSTIELTYELFEDICAQINSDSDTRQLAVKMLPNIEYDNNYHLLWALAQNSYSRLRYDYNRDKDFQYWMEKANMEDLYDRSAEQMIQWLEEKELLDEDNFNYLEPIVRKEVRIHNRELYVFKVAVKPQYRKYLKINK